MSFDQPHQLILFGPPGTSKSYLARHDKAIKLDVKDDDIFPLAFHPEFSYGEFVSRLLPLTKDKRIEYEVHAGPFLRALARAYVQLRSASEGDIRHVGNVVLLIDEINRGNCAEIFGDVFQLLDRDDDGWSSYDIGVSELTITALQAELERIKLTESEIPTQVQQLIKSKKLRLPPNLYLIGTMNTSDESIFYMDSAFKRRWNFEFCPVGFEKVPPQQRHALVLGNPKQTWETFLDGLNRFILKECGAPKMDDKLVGPWFIKAKKILPSNLAASHGKELAELAALADTVKEYHAGADNSEKFDAALLAFAEKMPPEVRKDILTFAGYENVGMRVMKKIAFDPDAQFQYYYSNQRPLVAPPGTMLIEDFLTGLEKLPSDIVRYHIGRTDIAGKLFLYLWDNVFDRDKAPLFNFLGLKRADLRTFGQFAEHLDLFVERMCVPPVPASVEAE